MPTLDWLGKDKVVAYDRFVPYHILNHKYNHGGSTDNKIIHGDNLLALKSLLPVYENKIKCIYIDPPYNTGNEGWIYNDNVNSPQIQKWIGQIVGREGEDFSRHDKWLCMMYPRLKILKRLLANDGAIFISIDDNEQHYLRCICEEIFGAQNFVKSKQGKVGTTSVISNEHEYITCYAKNFSALKFNMSVTETEGRKENLRQWGQADRREDRPTMFYPIEIDGRKIFPIKTDGTEGRWRVSENTANELLKNNQLEAVNKNGQWNIYRKFSAGKSVMPYGSWVSEKIGTTAKGTVALKNLGLNFSYPKPVELIEFILKIATDENSIVLDSFAGSGTTAHAVINLNQADGGDRKFILVEMEDYARRVGGTFDYYEIGETIFIDDELNEEIPLEQLRAYVWESTTRTKYFKPTGDDCDELLGVHRDIAYYFNYDGKTTSALDYEFLSKIKTRASGYVIYAEICALTEEFMSRHGIEFRKIPRDIH